MSPGEEIQRLIFATLTNDVDVVALVDGVHDRVPENAFGVRQAYISFGPSDMVPLDPDCITSEEHTFQLDVWSRKPGQVECRRICSAVKSALHLADLSLADNALVEIELVLQRIMQDPDGLTTHGVLQFKVTVEVP